MKNTVYKEGKWKIHQGNYKETIKSKFDMILTSPPYNIGSKAKKNTGGRKLGGFDQKNFSSIIGYKDNLPEDVYQESQIDFLNWANDALNPNGVLIYNHKDRQKDGRLISPYEWLNKGNLVVRDHATWDRGSTHNHEKRHVYNQTEHIFVLSKPGAKFYFQNKNFPWADDGNKGVGNIFRVSRAKNIGHCAPMPLKLAMFIIDLWCPKGGSVCDPYNGSGTSLIAAIMIGRTYVGAEREKKFVDMTLKRIKEELTNG